uniref:FAD/NAD(P)-binding domain-containing protein n=1 Tax=Acrobeloides nanus TaxID=290746 RepID=A0A914DCM1_9BILA
MSLFCNVNIGSDLTFDELSHDYNAIVLAYGANKSRYLNVPNADAKNCISGGDFVSWYNGAPSSSAPLLDKEDVVIIGNGNVSIDCARILLSSIERLKTTDMPAYAVDSLKQSRVRNVRIFGRRGPVEVCLAFLLA